MNALVILSPKISRIKGAREALNSLFKLKILDELMLYLRVSFKGFRNTMYLSQSAYCSRILKKVRMKTAKTASTPRAESINELFLEPVSREAEHKEEKEFLSLPG